MRSPILITALLVTATFAAQANEGVVEMSIKSKALASAGTVSSKQATAPFTSARDPMPQLLQLEEQEQRIPSGACEATTRDLCYDLADKRVVYRPARQYMPAIDGLKAENVTLRQHRIVFKYSFR